VDFFKQGAMTGQDLSVQRKNKMTGFSTRPGFMVGLVLIMAILFLSLQPAKAEKRIEQDLDRDGRMDQVLIYDDTGIILRVEIEEDHDGVVERLQTYQDGKPVRIERDTDNDKRIDTIDTIENEKRIRQERLDPDGNLVQVSLFDDRENICLMKKDTTADHAFDTLYYFENGELVSSTQDKDNNGRINRWTRYKNQVPFQRKHDDDEDGIMDQVQFFDARGRIEKLLKDPFAKEKYRTHIFFENGEIKTRNRDTNDDGRFDQVTGFENNSPKEQRKDTNHDGKFDVLTRFSSANNGPKTQEKDVDFDGTMDFFAVFDDRGRLMKTREDTKGKGKIDRIRHYRDGVLEKVEEDTDRDGFFETLTLMENNKIRHTQVDKNQDGKPDTEIFFNENQEKIRLTSDADFDGKMDIFQYYADNLPVKFEQDENGDSKPDLRVMYERGIKTCLYRDMDFDGVFEIVQTYDDPSWSLILSQDVNGDKHMDTRSFFTDKIMRQKEVDEDFDGLVDVVEIYNPSGDLERIEEKTLGKTSLTWFYGKDELLVQAQEDKNRDGRIDIWYVYENGRLRRVEEDTNKDGKPDLWEAYDETQAVVKREKDLDFDGKPDFTDIVKQAEQDMNTYAKQDTNTSYTDGSE
jgi:antitoxin component YwqK of YwqJK toxin-antitoxin module